MLIEVTKKTADLKDFYELVGESNPDTLQGIGELETKMKNQSPQIKQRISTYIERGTIADKVKKVTGYQCLICKALSLNPHSFVKPNGNYYVETHHVENVTTLKKGVLSISNLLTVCANHHRQLHFGKSEIISQTEQHFIFKIDDKVTKVQKINIS